MADQSSHRGAGAIGGGEERVDREDILHFIRNIRMDAGKGMRQYEPPQELLAMAKSFARWAPNEARTGHRLRFKDGMYYPILINDAHTKGVVSLADGRAKELITGWQVASKALFRYALNLHLTPKRPEFRRVKLTNSYYMYNVGGKLGNAKEVLVAMGYRPKATDSRVVQELEYVGEVDRENVLRVGTDLIVLYSELDLVKELADQLGRGRSQTPELDAVTLEDVLVARSRDEEKYDNLYRHFVKFKNIHHRQPQLLSGQPSPQYLRQSSERLQPQEEVMVDAMRRVSAPGDQIRGTLAPAGQAHWLRRTSAPYNQVQSMLGHPDYHAPPPQHPPYMDRVGRGHQVHYGHIPGPSQPRPPEIRPQDPSLGINSAPPYHHGSEWERERGPCDSGQTGRNQDHHKNRQSAPIHELLHDKNIHQKAPPTDPPLRHQPVRARGDRGSWEVPETQMYGQEPAHSNPMGRDFLQRDVEESLPKGHTPASAYYANASETGYSSVRSQPEDPAHHYQNIGSLLRSDDGEEVPLPTSGTPGHQQPRKGRQRTNTADRDRKVKNLYAQYPDLVNSARRQRGQSAIEDSLMYGDMEENSGRQELETTYEEEEEQGSDLSSLDLPEPVAKTKQDLGRMGTIEPSESSDSLYSMNPEIKDVHSVYDDFYRGPDLSLVPRPLRQGAISPVLEQGGSTAEKWKVSTTTELSGPSSLEYETEKSPSSSLEQQKSLGSDEMYGGPSCEEDKRSDINQEHLKSDRGALHPMGKPPPSPHSGFVKPKPLPRQRLGQRSNTMDDPKRERVRLPPKSNSASKLVESSTQATGEPQQSAANPTGEPENTDVNPTSVDEHKRSPVPSPRRLKPRTPSPRMGRRQPQPQPAEEPTSAVERGHSVPVNLKTQQKARQAPLNLRFGKHSKSQDLKSPPTVDDSKVSASMPDTVGPSDKSKAVLGKGFVHIRTPGTGPSSFENKFWECEFCTNLVLVPSPKCDICGSTTKKNTHKQP